LLVLFCVLAATQVAWGEDPHYDFAPMDDSDAIEMDYSADLELEEAPVDNSPLEIPSKPRKPAVPMLFAAASEMLQSWREAETHPEKPQVVKAAPVRKLASVPEETRILTQSELEKEENFREDVMQASLGEIPATYRKILNALQTGRITPRPIRDTGH
jgi:hypothetical protein